MRTQLKKINEERMRFRAKVCKFGERKNRFGYPPQPTLCLVNVTRLDTNQEVTDHVWFAKGTSWNHVKEGDSIEFDARVGEYWKGYVSSRHNVWNHTMDYKLNRPTKIVVLQSAGEVQQF